MKCQLCGKTASLTYSTKDVFICFSCENRLEPVRRLKGRVGCVKSLGPNGAGKAAVGWVHPKLKKWIKKNPVTSFAKVQITYF